MALVVFLILFGVALSNQPDSDKSAGFYLYELNTKRVFRQEMYVKETIGNRLKALNIFSGLEPDSVGEFYFLGTLDSSTISRNGRLIEVLRNDGYRGDIEFGEGEIQSLTSYSAAIDEGASSDSLQIFADRFGLPMSELRTSNGIKSVNVLVTERVINHRTNSDQSRKQVLGQTYVLSSYALRAVQESCEYCF